ncbi:MAG: ATP-binding cassette domain-containing protein, partial [Burkholderiales bacterium]|nr:ATP-binding cassette domain-containing protein [Burkholderiales bacterium]
QEEPGITMEPTSGTDLSLDSIDLEVRNGERLLSAASATIAPGERVLVRGASGSGKSTLFRAIAGIWPFGHGRIRVPAGFDALFLPQRPYFPLGTLRDAIVYPAAPESVTEERLLEAMHAVGLDTMVDRLDEKAIWSQQLSGGEQQRVAFARALLLSPRWLFLDEATSNLDAVAEQKLYTLLTERLKDTAIISIAHRPEIAAFHDRVLTLDAEADTLVETSAPA